MSEQGLLSLPTQWGFAETAAKKYGTTVDRKNLACAAELARRRDARQGPRGGQARPDELAQRIHHRHLAAAGRRAVHNPDEAVDKTAFMDGAPRHRHARTTS
jgi:limonene 1,2-monooxygenase